MNNRLVDIYNDIEKNNSDEFLKNYLKLDTMWNSPIWGITLQIELETEVQNVIENFQIELNSMESGNLLFIPRVCQHISFNQVVFWNGTYVTENQKVWADIKDNFIDQFQDINRKISSFEITFFKLVATTDSIIWCAKDPADELENLRKYFLEKLPFPKETTYLNHIIHTTVARYAQKLNKPNKVMEYVKSQNRTATMRVSKIVLKNELVFPSIKADKIAEIYLK